MEDFKAFDESFDFGSFIHYPEENMESVDFQLPAMDTSADALDFSDMPLFPEMDSSLSDADFNLFGPLEYPVCDSVNETAFTAEPQPLAPQADDFRYVVDSWASADHRLRSTKQKRRDAAIDLHLQRFMNTHADPQLFPADSDVSPSDTPSITYSQGSSQQSPVDSTSASSTSTSDNSAAAPAGGCEFIFDMNLNTATKLPKKQKKRTQAQIKDYINVRRNGACVKHKKQHKKCNCHEKLSAKAGVDVSKRRRAAVANKPILTPELILNNTPSSLSMSSFSQSPLSQLDSVSFGDEIDTALASLEEFSSLDTFSEMPTQGTVFQEQYVSKDSAGFVSTTRQRAVNAPDLSTHLQSTAHLSRSSVQDATSNDLLPQGLSNASNMRVEHTRVESTRVESARVESARVESARVESARVESARVESARVESARVESARVESARVESARVESARVESATERTIQRSSGSLQTTGSRTDQVLDPSGRHDPARVLRHAPAHDNSSSNLEHGSLAELLPTRAVRATPARPTLRSVTQSSMPALSTSRAVTRSLRPALPAPSMSPVSPAPSLQASPLLEVIRTQPGLLQAPLTTPASTALMKALSEVQSADLSNPYIKDVLQTIYTAAVQQNHGDPTALLTAVEWISWLSGMVMQTMQSIMTLRPHLFQFLPEQVRRHSPEALSSCISEIPSRLAALAPQAIAACA